MNEPKLLTKEELDAALDTIGEFLELRRALKASCDIQDHIEAQAAIIEKQAKALEQIADIDLGIIGSMDRRQCRAMAQAALADGKEACKT